jgi:hypothetical protein
MTRRNFVVGALGWVAPGLAAVPIGLMQGRTADPFVPVTVLAWWVLGMIGCTVAGIILGASHTGLQSAGSPFASGLAGVATSWIGAIAATVAIDVLISWLDISGGTVLMPIPLIVGYCVGYALGHMFGPLDPA